MAAIRTVSDSAVKPFQSLTLEIGLGEAARITSTLDTSSMGRTVTLSAGVCGLRGDASLEGGTSHGEGGTDTERGTSSITLKEAAST